MRSDTENKEFKEARGVGYGFYMSRTTGGIANLPSWLLKLDDEIHIIPWDIHSGVTSVEFGGINADKYKVDKKGDTWKVT